MKLRPLNIGADISISLTALVLRLAAGIMLTHGWPKLAGFSERAEKFADPLGVGPTGSLALVIFAEFFCTCFIVLGVFTRVSTIPLMFTMLVIIFLVHGGDPFGDKEMAVLYFLLYAAIFILGPGKFSLDRKIFKVT